MRKFYNRNGSEPCEECPADSNEDLGSQGASCSSASDSGGRSSSENSSEKGSFVMSRVEAFRKRDRHTRIFGSLLKKSRTTVCIDEAAPKKKLLAPENINFQAEMKKKKGFVEKVRNIIMILADEIINRYGTISVDLLRELSSSNSSPL